METVSLVGYLAAALTSAANLPQAIKCWRTGETHDISLRAFSLLALGLSTWVIYGALNDDIPIMVANSISTAIALSIIAAKVRHG
jgi:MtN3 and saliva related transmembrane protein